MTVLERLEMLKPLGVEWHHDYKYEGQPGKDRHRVELPEKITGVLLPLTPEEWCRTCMREGDMYVGPCCGNTGAMQDVINGVFRDGGWIDNEDFWYVGFLARNHDGFEYFGIGEDDDRFERAVQAWMRQLDEPLREGVVTDTWAKIGIVYSAVEPALIPRSYEMPSPDRNGDGDPVRKLVGALSYLDWESLFGSDRGREDLDAQHSANRLEVMARALKPASQFLQELSRDDAVFEGVALVKPDSDEILSNRAGYCIYANREQAEYWIEAMKRHNEEYEEEDHDDPSLHAKREPVVVPDIVPVRVSVQEGTQLIRG